MKNISLLQSYNTDTLMPNSLDELAAHCRICLTSASTEMVHLFEEQNNRQGAEDMSLMEKLNNCSCFASHVHPEDHLPKYICMSCSVLVENAYQLKVLCAKTEKRFEELIQDHKRKNDEDTAETDQANIEYEPVSQFLYEEETVNMKIEVDEYEMTYVLTIKIILYSMT